ncbi:MAG: single-stranded-DNA-specific exonuclease RecJ, partial [Planctomycetota bacterium]
MSAVASPSWRFTPLDPHRVRRLCEALSILPLTAQVLIARGLDEPAKAKAFLTPSAHDLHDPERLPGVPQAADRIVAAVRAGRGVTIFGDYDVDGITSTALLVDCLRLAGANVDYVIPNRNDGYGLNVAAVEKLHADGPDRLVVTVDCGIASVAEAERAKELGLELIVTDHHTPGETLPDAAVVVHPRRPDAAEAYPFGELCGAGVAFKLAWAVAKRLGDGQRADERFRQWLMRAIGLAALATVADLVPLTGENRTIVHVGLRSLYHRAPPGLRALLNVCGIDARQAITAEDVGFKVAPRINAAGRLDQASLAVDLLLSDDPKRCAQLAEYLNQLNETRKKTEAEVVKSAKKQAVDEGWAERPGLTLASDDWHAGVVGIAAGRVAEKFDCPAIVIAFGHRGDPDLGAGPARSRPGFD